MKAPKNESKQFEPVPEGTQLGIIIGLYNLGRQSHTFQGEEKLRDEFRVTFELPKVTREFDGETKPMVISKSGSYSIHPKSFLRKVIESALGHLKDSEAEALDMEKMLGKPVLLNIKHFEKNDGGKAAYIESVTPIVDGMEIPKQFNKNTVFDIADYSTDEYDELPQFLKDKVDAALALKEKLYSSNVDDSNPF